MRTFLAGASRAVLLGLLCVSAQAATTFDITTNSMARAVDGVCTLQEVFEVIRTGNTVNECIDTNGPYTINLAAGTYTVTQPTDGSQGLSAARVLGETTINGNGATIAGNAANMRAFLVDAPLTLSNLVLTGFSGAVNATVIVQSTGQVNLDRVVLTANGTAGRPLITVNCSACQTNLHRSAAYLNVGSSVVFSGGAVNVANSTLDPSMLAVQAGPGVASSVNLSNATIQGGITIGGSGGSLRLVNSIVNGNCTLGVGLSVTLVGTNFADDCPGGSGEGTLLLDNNGGSTRTYASIRGDSGAVDASPDPCLYASTGTNPLFANGAANTVDQRGEPRDALCDSGAYETAFPATLPNGIVGVAYNTTPVAGATTFRTGGSGPLPPGLNFVVGGALQGAPTAAGSFTFDLQANRSGSRKDFAHYTVTITTAPPPNTTLTATPPNPSSNASPSFSFTGVDNGAGIFGFQCRIDLGAFAPCTSPFVVGPISDGSHTFTVRALDNAGTLDPTPANFTWVTDTVAPDTSFNATPLLLSNLGSPTFQFSGTDPGGSGVAGFQCQLDGAPFAACTSPALLTALADGAHTFVVRAIDAAGNVDPSPASYTWTIDATALAPVITSPAAASSVLPNPPISGTGENGATVTVLEGAATVCTATVAGGAWSCASTLGVGAHTINATQLDTAGNTSVASAAVTFTVAVPVNTYTAPSATGSGAITASFTGGGPTCTFGVRQFIPLSGNPASPPAGSAPAGVTFPHGLFDFTTTGCTPGSSITMTITYPNVIPGSAQYYKYGPTLADPAPHWYVIPATLLGNTVTFTIVDGGLGDDDLAANGTVVDQGGPGIPAGGLAAANVPTLGVWGMLLLIAGMLVTMRRRRRS